MRTRMQYGSDGGNRDGELKFAIVAAALWTAIIVTVLSLVA